MPVPPILAFLESLGTMEFLLIALVALLLFGGRRLPDFARGLGKTMRELKKISGNMESEFRKAMDATALEEPPQKTNTILPPSAQLPSSELVAEEVADPLPPPPAPAADASPAETPEVSNPGSIPPGDSPERVTKN